MSINIDNYELFVIDYLDGNLDEIKTKEMEAFLLMYPDIATEIEDLNSIKLKNSPFDILEEDFIKDLKKTEIASTEFISEDNYEDIFIAHVENDLNDIEEEDLETFLQLNHLLQPNLTLIKSLKLQADNQIVFPNKEQLKRHKKPIMVFWPVAAAVAALLLWVFWVYTPVGLPHSVEVLSMVEPVNLQKLSIPVQEPVLPHIYRLNPHHTYPVIQDELPRDHIVIEPVKARPVQVIAIEDEQWKNTMLLMQSYAFDRQQMFSEVDWSKLPADRKTTAFRMIASVLWKTTKGQIKNVGEQVLDSENKFWRPEAFQELSDAYNLMKRKPKE